MEALLGVTRVARVTGLDRSGVEVACAVRPTGYVLQVSNGKGRTWDEARLGALSEGAELWAAEHPHDLVYAAQSELQEAWEPAPLVAPRLWSRATRIAWTRGRDLRSRRPVWVPAQAVFCPPRGPPPLGPAVVRWTSNGMGAHPRRQSALQHALLEACERDQLARTLPRGWTLRAIATRKIDVRGSRLWQQLRDARLEAHVFDLSGDMSVAGALLVDVEEGPVPLTAGYCCALAPERAVDGAMLEAAQSRLTDVHGAREDVTAPDLEAASTMRDACARARPSRTLREMPRRSSVRLPVGRIAVVDLCHEPLHVVKVYAPGLRVSELL